MYNLIYDNIIQKEINLINLFKINIDAKVILIFLKQW